MRSRFRLFLIIPCKRKSFGLGTKPRKGVPFLSFNRIRFSPTRHCPELTGRLTDLRRLNCLNVVKAPAQSCCDDQNYGDHTEISGLVSSRRMLLHLSDHQEFVSKLLRYDLQRTLLARLVGV